MIGNNKQTMEDHTHVSLQHDTFWLPGPKKPDLDRRDRAFDFVLLNLGEKKRKERRHSPNPRLTKIQSLASVPLPGYGCYAMTGRALLGEEVCDVRAP